MLISINIIAWTRKIYTIRQFGNSAIRQFGNSAIRQFGNSLNRSLTLALALSAVLTVNVRAQWTGAASDNLFNNPTNWVDGDINGQFTYNAPIAATLDSAVFAAGATTVYTGTYNAKQLLVGATISGDGIAAGTTIVAINSGGQITLSQATTGASNGSYDVTGYATYGTALPNLDFKNSGAGAGLSGTITLAGNFTMLNDKAGNTRIESGDNSGKLIFTNPNASVIIGTGGAGDLFYTLGSANRSLQVEFLGNAVFNIDPALVDINNLTFNFQATTTIAGSLTKNGWDRLAINGRQDQNVSMNGAVTVNGGVLQLATTNAGTMTVARISGATKYDLINRNSALYLDTALVNAGQTAGYNLVESTAKINLYSGELVTRGDGNSVFSSQSVGDVTLYGGKSAIGFDTNTAAANDYTLELNSLTRKNDGTVNLFGSVVTGSSKLLVINDANILADWVGTSTTAGATNLKILPWASANTYSPNISEANTKQTVVYAGSNLVTYTHDGGFRALTDAEYHVGFADAAADDNVMIGTGVGTVNDSISAATTINALRYNADGGTVTLNDTLSITSGVFVVTRRGQVTITGPGGINTGNRAFIVYGQDGSANISTSITNQVTGDNASVILGHVGGWSILSGTNDYAGTTLVQGSARIDNDYAIPLVSALRVDNGGWVQINTTQVKAASLAGTGTVTFNGSNKKLGLGSVSATDALNAITVHSGAFIAPGDPSGALQAGTLNLGVNIASVNFLAGSIFNVDIASDSLSDQLAIFNTSSPVLGFADGAIIRLNFLNDYTPDADTDWLLTAGFASLSGDLNNVLLQNFDGSADLGDAWSLSAINGNLLLSYTIPEPSTWALLAGGVALLLVLRRRR